MTSPTRPWWYCWVAVEFYNSCDAATHYSECSAVFVKHPEGGKKVVILVLSMFDDGLPLWLLCGPLDSVIVINTNAIFMFILTLVCVLDQFIHFSHKRHCTYSPSVTAPRKRTGNTWMWKITLFWIIAWVAVTDHMFLSIVKW